LAGKRRKVDAYAVLLRPRKRPLDDHSAAPNTMSRPTKLMISDTHATTDLGATEGVLKANLGQLRCSPARPAPTQIAAVRAIEGLILTASKQQAGWGRLRLRARRASARSRRPHSQRLSCR
jgi:hypothetical protein